MTPKQKAIELVERFLYLIRGADRYSYNLEDMNNFIAKQCAFIAAEEGEKYEKNVLVKFKLMPEEYKSDYWAEVKKEIHEL